MLYPPRFASAPGTFAGRCRTMVAAAGLLLSLALTAAPAAAQTQPAPGTPPAPPQSQTRPQQQTNRLQLVKMNSAPSPTVPGAIRFTVLLGYQLQSSQQGRVMMFIYENDAERAAQRSAQPVAVRGPGGRATLDLDYVPRPGVDTLSVLLGLFDPGDQLLSYVSTNPFSLKPWPGYALFEKAMAARIAKDYEGAAALLSEAITLSPDTGAYYYWRGDSLARLERFDAALPDYDRALELMPGDRVSQVGRGAALLWLGSIDAAVLDFTAAIDNSLRPDRWTAWAYRARGIAREGMNQWAEAISDFEAYLALTTEPSDRVEVENRLAGLRG